MLFDLSTIEKPLRLSGSFWPDRLVKEQQPLARAMAMTAADGTDTQLEHAVNWLLEGSSAPTGHRGWTLDLTTNTVQFAHAYAAGLRVGRKADKDQPYLAQSMERGMFAAGAEGGWDDWRTPEGNPFTADTFADLDGISTSPEVIVIPYSSVPALVEAESGLTSIVVGANRYLWYYGTAGPLVNFDIEIDVVKHDVWFVKLTDEAAPSVLLTAHGPLFEGVGFHTLPGWLVLFSDPLELWPSMLAVGLACHRQTYMPRSSALNSDMLKSGGRHVARYRRIDQSPAQFERALSEIAGERVLDYSARVASVTHANNRTFYWLDDDTEMELPGPPIYEVGQVVPARTAHRLRIRSTDSDGPDFWRGKDWARAGVSSNLFWPGSDLLIQDKSLVATSFDYDGTIGVFIDMLQDAGLTSALWERINSMQKLAGSSSWAEDVLGFTAIGQVRRVNLLEVMFSVLGNRLLVLEGDLGLWDAKAHHLVKWWAERERPSGSILIQGWTW